MDCQRIPLLFDCHGDTLLGMLHQPAQSQGRGVLAIVAGGPQYKAGCCRQLNSMAEHVAGLGFPVMRFDYRGMGDSEGTVRGFEHIQDDLAAAITTFLDRSPELKEIVLWGGCDAAAAAMIHGPNHPEVTGMILANPWVHSDETHAKVVLKHYYWQRLREKSFWMKLLQLRMNPLEKLRSVMDTARQAKGNAVSSPKTDDANLPFVTRMLHGMQNYDGRIQMFMSGQSIVSKEFDELLAASKPWASAMSRIPVTRVDMPDADQTFSSLAQQRAVAEKAGQWLQQWAAEDQSTG